MADGVSTGDTPLRHAGRGAGGGDGAARHHRATLPVDRSVLWTPSRDPGDPGGPAASGPYELFLTRSVVRAIDVHSSAEGRQSRFGFLLGQLYRCPDTGVHYAVADRAVLSEELISEDVPDPFLLRAWAESQAAFREHGGVLIGWYHSHYLLGLILSEGDREMNERYFGEPWQCCVLTVPDRSRPMGAVFRPSAAQAGAEAEPTPFRELLAVEDIPASGPLASALKWKNYIPDREVLLAPADADMGEAPETPPVIGVPSGRDSVTSSMTLVLPDNRPERLYPRLPIRRRTIVWLLAIVALTIGGYMGGVQLLRSGGEAAPDEAAPVERLPRRPPEVERFLQASIEVDEAMLGYEERRQDFDLGRIGCELLAGGYAVADDAFISMAGAYAALGAAADEQLTADYERIVEDMNQLNQHFDASACPRPE